MTVRSVRSHSIPDTKSVPADDSLGLSTRLRRNRKSDWSRRLVRENTLTVDDLICRSS